MLVQQLRCCILYLVKQDTCVYLFCLHSSSEYVTLSPALLQKAVYLGRALRGYFMILEPKILLILDKEALWQPLHK